MSKIQAVGFEIEGGWAGKPGVAPFNDCQVVADHSINGQTLYSGKAIKATHVGEVVSEPIPFSPDAGAAWEEWLSSHWPNAEPAERTNRTCGFHIHISLDDWLSYAQLTSKSFLLALRDRMIEVGREVELPKKHPFWERMHGGNTFCDLFFDPAAQMRLTSKGGRTRYGWLNFAFSMHGTVEFRALPTFRDAHVAVRFAREYFQLVDFWLASCQDVKLVRTKSFKG